MNTLCPDKENCGSCSWSHIPYDKQVQQKLSDINGSFALKKLNHRVEEILASPVTEHYRNRMDFVIDFEGRVGMRMKGKWWKVIDGHTCFLADEEIEKLFHIIRHWSKKAGLSYFDRKAHTGILRYAVIRATKKGETMVNIITSGVEGEEIEQVKKALAELNELANPTTLIWSQNHTITDVSYGDEMQTIAGPGVIEETVGGNKYLISPNAFFQTNSHAVELLLGTVQEFAGDLTEKTLLDLYCGSGFFSVAMSSETKKTVGVELNEEAIKDAVKNAEINDANVEYVTTRTEDYDWSVHNADVVILDPPRAGMHDKALKDVMKHQPETIIYVSCNYKNFARELVKLQDMYDVTAMRAIDMFPHTPHVELVAKLERKEK